MKLYKLTRPDSHPVGWDDYIELIVASPDAEAARLIIPGFGWIASENVVVKEIGIALDPDFIGIVCESFNAG